MVHRLVVTFGHPADPPAFDDYRRNTHIPLVLQLPGLVRLTVGHAEPMDPVRPVPYLMAELDFESAQAMRSALASPEGRAVGDDLVNFADGGAELTHFDVEVIKGQAGGRLTSVRG